MAEDFLVWRQIDWFERAAIRMTRNIFRRLLGLKTVPQKEPYPTD